MARGGNPPVVPLVMTGAGLILLLSAIKDLNPLEAAKNIATGKSPLDAKYVSPDGTDGSGAGGDTPPGGLVPGDVTSDGKKKVGPGFTLVPNTDPATGLVPGAKTRPLGQP